MRSLHLLAIACFSSAVLEEETMFFYSGVARDHGVQSPRRGRYQVTLFDKYFMKKRNFTCFKLVLA